ncbi:hypothetical protein PhCBS80983_g00682 [Powellomyces hirtus]|uniref:Uncharacterized protein n=1 Tax=Powellomyces hirtus TaxID=109895 RepID=A0A507EFC1_9FUNG|nr:hypothetical protein PhCBS80983_g00682 [Powellomyces hirtus]
MLTGKASELPMADERGKLPGGDSYVDDDCGPSSFFVQADEMNELLGRLLPKIELLHARLKEYLCANTPTPWTPPQITNEEDREFDKSRQILDIYQEQPHLLDPHLERLVQPTMQHLREVMATLYENEGDGRGALVEQCMVTFRPFMGFLYHLTKVRGHKTIIKFFPHEVADMEPVLFCLESITHKANDPEFWEGRYVLLLWLSLLSMIPFDLQTVDSGTETGGTPLVERILNLGKTYLYAVSKEYEGAALLLMRVITRKDTAGTYLSDFVTWAAAEVHASRDVFKQRGMLLALCTIYKGGRRELLLPTLDHVLPCCNLVEEPFAQNNALLRKLLIKLTQRAGLTFMKPRAAKWRYDRGNRSLESNLGGTSALAPVNDICDTEDDDDDIDVPESMDTIVGILLNGLRDKDTIVRWSSAKGIGRIMNRLPHDLGQDIVQSIISLLEEDVLPGPGGQGYDLSQVSDSTWHGSCLALAELARRGLLLPLRLEEVVPWILLALKFDQRRGAHSIGAHVRDAACYVCWSFARAYAAEIIQPFVDALAKALVVVSLCDREVNIRRAASAAFQENVGRQGLFPHGIDIVTAADYFAVGNRTSSFLEIAVSIARFPEYHSHICDHVANVSLVHWDPNVRELAASTLAKLTPINTTYMSQTVLPALITRTTSDELAVRHGSLLAIGEICLAWYAAAIRPSDTGKLNGTVPWRAQENSGIVTSLSAVIATYPARYLDGFGGELTRFGCCKLIARLAEAQWPESVGSEFIKSSWKIAITSLAAREESVQVAAAAAVGSLNSLHHMDDSTLRLLIGGLSPEKDKHRRRGYALALGDLMGFVLSTNATAIIKGLTAAVAVHPDKALNDAESRRNAVQSLSMVCTHLDSQLPMAISPDMFETIREALFNGLQDYSTDSRGDVGSWVRQACMRAFQSIVMLLTNPALDEVRTAYLPEQAKVTFIGELCKQSVEKIDRMREVAGQTLLFLLWEVPGFEFEGMALLRERLPRNAEMSWSSAAESYPTMIPLLTIPQFRIQMLSGLVVSIGGLSESLVRHSSTSFVQFVNNLPDMSSPSSSDMTLGDLFDALLQVFRQYHRQDRVSMCILETLDLLFGCGAIARCGDAALYETLFTLVKQEVFKSKDVKKLLAGIKVFCGFVSLSAENGPAVAAIRQRALSQLVMYLAHPYPKVRRAVAEQLYLALASNTEDQFGDDDMEADDDVVGDDEAASAEDILLSTDWDLPVSQLKDTRDRLKILVLG